MDGRTRGLLRDGVLALVALAGLGRLLRQRGQTDALRSPRAALAGVLGSIGIEVVLFRYPDVTRAVWERHGVQAGSLLGALSVSRLLTEWNGGFAAAACCWGLVTYLGLLAVVLAGRDNPVAALAGGRVNE